MPNDKEFELDDLEAFSFDDLSLDEAPPAETDSTTAEDPFGVWVKSAPEDIAPDAPVPEAEPLDSGLPEEDFLSSEELAKLDDSFDFVTVSDEPLEGETPLEDEIAFLDTPEAVEAEKSSPSAASFDEVSLDDFVSFDDVPLEEVSEFASETGATGIDGPTSEEDASEEFLDIDIDIEDDIGDEELEIIEGATPRVPDEMEEISLDGFSAQSVDLSEFGDFEEVSPVAEGPLAGAEDLPDVLDIPEALELPEDLELPQDLALSDDVDLPEENGFFEETVLEDPLDLDPHDQTDLDHILALEEDLTAGIRTAPEPTAEALDPVPPPPPSDLAALILSKIEQELSSIKQEISELKNEVTHLRSAPPALAQPPLPEPIPEPETKAHGFFDEEDDETIALTGDELDNILSTAEISEGEELGVSLDDDLLGLDAEGNLLAPEPEVEEAHVTDEVHVTDEEFLAGTALDLNEPDVLVDDQDDLGIPESIELEEGLPMELEEGQTEDLLATTETGINDFEVAPLPEGILEGSPEPLEIPFDDDIGWELEDSAPLAPDLNEPAPEPIVDLPEEAPSELADLPPLETDSEGWSPPALAEDAPQDLPDDLEFTLEEESAPEVETPLPPPPPVREAPVGTIGGLSTNLKDELKAVLQYMDKLLASLPDDKIQEFAESEHFEVYKRLFEELGLIE